MKSIAMLIIGTVTLSGCSYFQPAPPVHASLTRSLELVDSSGTHFGHVELEPFGNGKLIDADGKVIGRVVPLGDTQSAQAQP